MTFAQIGAIGAIFGLLSVALGAFGAHALKTVLTDYGHIIWRKAFLYQSMHALVLVFIPIMHSITKSPQLKIAAYLFIAGILFFSGSLYVLALTEIKSLGAITPIGGFAFIFGWGYVAYAYLKSDLS